MIHSGAKIRKKRLGIQKKIVYCATVLTNKNV